MLSVVMLNVVMLSVVNQSKNSFMSVERAIILVLEPNYS